jgi:hypothetical protein
MKSKSMAVLVCAALSSLFTPFSLAQVSLPTIQASGNHRFLEHAGREQTLQGQLLVVRAETRRLLGGISHIPTRSVGDNDWAFDVGSNGAASGWPSTYRAGTNPDSVNDYVSFTIQAQGTSTRSEDCWYVSAAFKSREERTGARWKRRIPITSGSRT